MSTERDAAIVKSARQWSQACSELFAYLGEDLDRRMRAALGPLQYRRSVNGECQHALSTNHAGDQDTPSVCAGPEE
jgi:hypothetical protein